LKRLHGFLNAIYGGFLVFSCKENYDKLLEYREQKLESPFETREIYKENIR